MKRQYDKQEITRILGKFMVGETSLDEEHLLAEYFRSHEVGDEWQEYKEMFALFDSGTVDIEPEEETKHPTNFTDAKVRKLPKAVNEKPKIVPIRWIMTGIAASVLLLLGFSLLTNDGEPKQQSPMVAQISKPTKVKPTTETPPATYGEPQAQQQPKKVNRRKHKAVTKPQEAPADEPVQMSEETRLALLMARHNENVPQAEEIDTEEEIRQLRKRGERLISMYEVNDK